MDTRFNFRIDNDVLKAFQKYCVDNNTIPSDLLRDYIYHILSLERPESPKPSRKYSHDKPPKKRPIPLGLRYKILVRDNFKCVICGKSPTSNPGLELHVDHIVPESDGGEHVSTNLRTLCKDCNTGKGDSCAHVSTKYSNSCEHVSTNSLKKVLFDPLTGEPLNQ